MFRTAGFILHFPTLVSRSPRFKAIVTTAQAAFVRQSFLHVWGSFHLGTWFMGDFPIFRVFECYFMHFLMKYVTLQITNKYRILAFNT